MLTSRTVGAATVVALAASLLVGGTGAAQASDTHADTGADVTPSVWPQPQQVQARDGSLRIPATVGEVVGTETDPSAVQVVEATLHRVGVRHIVTRKASQPPPPTPVTFYVGGPGENDASADALSSLGVRGPRGLPDEGYVLAAGRGGRGPVPRPGRHALVVLSGVDATGTFYAAQTLRQLLQPGPGLARLHAVVVRDWPAMKLRGVIEGFYGPPWSTEDRLSQLDFYGRTKQNIYVYSPKDDPYLRARWRQPYPPDKLAVINKLVDRATRDHVRFTYALSPGLSICYSSDADLRALVGKLASMYDIGVRSFAIPLDDISYTRWNCDQDEQRFGTGGAAAGRAQSYLLNRVQQGFVATHPDVDRLQMVPTEYYNVSDSPYKTALREHLSDKVIVEWTGVGVIAPVITADQAKQAHEVFGHDILVWDNYPVNDYVRDRLLMGPYVGREPGVKDYLVGVTANPMIQAEASKIAEFTSGAFLWNPDTYDPKAAWLASVKAFAGSQRRAMEVFAENNYSSRLNDTESPTLAPLISAFWDAYRGGDAAAAGGDLSAYLTRMESVPGQLRAGLDNPNFLAGVSPWLDKLGLYGKAGKAAVGMLLAQQRGNGGAAWTDRLRLQALREQIAAIPQTVAPGVMDPFLDRAAAASDRWLGAGVGRTKALTSLGTYQSYVPKNMVDGDDSTFFWSNGAPGPGDYVEVDLGALRTISAIDLRMSKPSSPDDYIHQGALETSTDGTTWTTVATGDNQREVTAALPAGTKARYVRYRATGAQTNWVVVRELSVTTDTSGRLTATGTPAAAPGSDLADAADGAVATAYEAANAPQPGDALTVSFAEPRPLDTVVVLQDPQAPAKADVQVHTSGRWRSIGSLDGGYTGLSAGGVTADAIRLAWAAGSPAPRINEVIPWYGDVPVADLSVLPASLGAEAGGDAVTATARLVSTRGEDVTGTLTVDAPSGWTVRPAAQRLTVHRGQDATEKIAIAVPAGTPLGSYPVTVTFSSGGGDASAAVTVDVHLRTTDTNLAVDGTASASCVEGDGAYPQFAPRYAVDGDMSTRWSSCYDDSAWLQVELPGAVRVGKVVLHWEAAYGKAYRVEASADGANWTTAATVTGGDGGSDVIWVDAPNTRFVRMQGVDRATVYGYSIYELEVYPAA